MQKKVNNSLSRPVFPAQYNKVTGAAGKKIDPTRQDTLEHINSLTHQLQAMASGIGAHEVAYYLQLACREAQRSPGGSAAEPSR